MFNILTPNKFQLNATEMINFGIYTTNKKWKTQLFNWSE